MILTRPSYERAFAKLSAEQKARVDSAVGRLEASFGQPHRHSGLGLRSIGSYFEFRAGWGLRVLFVISVGDLILVMVGNHDQIARFVRSGG